MSHVAADTPPSSELRNTATTAGISVRPGAAVVLCVGLTMPSSAPASQQGLSTDFTATITGTEASA